MTTTKESPDLTAHEQGLSWAEQLKPKESPDKGAGARELLRKIDIRFKSGNSTPVERAHVTAEEWESIKTTMSFLAAETDSALRRIQAFRSRVRSLEDAEFNTRLYTRAQDSGQGEAVALGRWGRSNDGVRLLEPMDDGYWTPWHIAQAALDAAHPPKPAQAGEKWRETTANDAEQVLDEYRRVGDLAHCSVCAMWTALNSIGAVVPAREGGV